MAIDIEAAQPIHEDDPDFDLATMLCQRRLGYVIHPALSDYRAPQVIVDIAIDKAGKGTYVMKGRRPKGNVYYYVTPEFVLACVPTAAM